MGGAAMRSTAACLATAPKAVEPVQEDPIRKSSPDPSWMPLHLPQPYGEVAAAAYRAPYRGVKRDRLAIRIEFERPKWSSFGDKVELDDFAAPAWAEHRSAPEMPVLADQVDLLGAESIGKFLDDDRSASSQISPEEPPEP